MPGRAPYRSGRFGEKTSFKRFDRRRAARSTPWWKYLGACPTTPSTIYRRMSPMGQIFVLKVSPRHTGRLRAQAIAALREAVLDLESRSHAFVASRPAAASAATLALPLARALLQAGAYGSALNAVDDALQRCSDHAERLILNVEAAEIELHAQLIAAAGKRLETTRQLLKTVDMPLAVAGPCTFRIETLEAFLSPDYFVALERCEQAVRSFRSWLLEHGCTRDSAMRVIWALCCISEIARTAGLPSRARSAVV